MVINGRKWDFGMILSPFGKTSHGPDLAALRGLGRGLEAVIKNEL
jgi:hypothetical protein